MRAILVTAALAAFISTSLCAEGLSSTQCPGPTNDTLAYYESNFGTTPCANGILNFSKFNFQVYQPSGPGTVLNASQIDLTPIGTPNQTGATGFEISGLNNTDITAAVGQDVTYVIDWDYVIDAGPIAGGASLGMDPPTGDITITEYFCLDSNFVSGTYNGSAPSCTPSIEGTLPSVQTLTVSDTPADACPTSPGDYCSSINFNPPDEEFANVMTVIQLTGGTNGATFGSTNGTTQINPPAPEPGTLLLIPGALAFLFFFRRRAVAQ